MPFLAYTQPRIARNLLRFRHSMLGKARQRARDLELRGALFPWRTITGDEASAYHLAGTAQFHLNADIAYAVRRYVDVRGDTAFLVEAGAEVLVETARMGVPAGKFPLLLHHHPLTMYRRQVLKQADVVMADAPARQRGGRPRRRVLRRFRGHIWPRSRRRTGRFRTFGPVDRCRPFGTLATTAARGPRGSSVVERLPWISNCPRRWRPS